MYLSSIALHGFKSFADKTAVHFDPGVTAIVGPNGCGKSNIIDAVRWVLGEQRARLLRSEKMENVIFNGAGTRRALGLAEVSLSIHNTRGVLPTEYTDVTISRRLYRSGESEYLLNGTVCRLKDILDLFMDTGMGAGAYSVIELKMIEDILSENAADRRRLFEEAAGITKYKLRRGQALRRLDTTQADLTRLADLTDEIEKNVRSLSRQATKAQRHQTLQERLRTLELGLAAADFARLDAERQALDTDAGALRDRVAERTVQLQTREAEAEALRTALLDRERALAEHQRALNAHVEQIRTAEAEVRLAEERRAAAEAALDRLGREADADTARAETLRAEAETLAEQAEEATAAAAEAEAHRAERDGEHETAEAGADAARAQLGEAQAAARHAADRLAGARADLDAQRQRRALLEDEVQRIEAQTREVKTVLAETEARTEATAAARQAAEAARAETETAFTEAEAEVASLDGQLGTVAESLRAARRQYDAATAEADILQSLLDSYEGFSDAAQTLLAAPDGPACTVADLLACDAGLRPAVDAALGPLADALVAQTEAEAHAGLARLRNEQAGRATFLVLDRLPERPPPPLSATPPGTTPLATSVRTDAAHGRLPRVLLQNVFLAGSLAEAEALHAQYPAARFVTAEGEWVSGSLVHAGGDQASASAERLGRREQLDAARAQAEAARAESDALDADEQRLRAAREALDLGARRAAAREAERALDARAREAGQVEYEAAAQARRLSELAARRAKLQAELDDAATTAGLETALTEATAAHEAAAQARADAEVAYSAAEAASRAALARFSEANLVAVQARTRLDALGRDRDRTDLGLADLATRDDERQAEAGRLRASLDEAAGRIATQSAQATRLRDTKADLDQAVTTAETDVSDARSAISDTDALLREVRRLREEAQQAQGAGEIRRTEIGTRLEAITERVWEAYGVAPGEIEVPPDFDADEARREVPDLRAKLRTIGAVNELALESYEEEKQRLEFLREQQHDLEQAEASLRSTIREINATASARFNETFSAVRREFQRLFKDLFGQNASADIVLAGDDPLEDPIEIRARPKGKKPSAITQLSGGEKTLTAIALLFAIYLVKPSPFCILDEVDAPLDDANVERFMGLIRAFAESTQFILVTHNKLTMEAADRMYGVTMQEEGVSKLVGVRFDEVLPEAA
ncbi:MAG: chromosome segregation protein SMC [Bacteroidota bacterium]